MPGEQTTSISLSLYIIVMDLVRSLLGAFWEEIEVVCSNGGTRESEKNSSLAAILEGIASDIPQLSHRCYKMAFVTGGKRKDDDARSMTVSASSP